MFSKGKFMTRRNIYPLRENIVLSTKCSSVVILPERGCLVHPGVVPQLVVSAGGRSVIHQQVWPGETWWMEVMLLNPYITSVSITMTILFMCSLCSDRHGWGKKLTIHRMRHPFYKVIELLRCYTLMSIYTWYKYLCNLGHLERSFHIVLPQMSFSLFFHSWSFQWSSSQYIGSSPWISEQSHILLSLLTNKMHDHVYHTKIWEKTGEKKFIKILPQGDQDIPLFKVFLGLPTSLSLEIDLRTKICWGMIDFLSILCLDT